MPHEIHVSERRAFRGCRRRWDLAYRQRYQPDIQAPALTFGIAFHVGLEAFYDPDLWDESSLDDKHARALGAFEQSLYRQVEDYLEATSQRELDPDARDRYLGDLDLGRGMLTHYAFVVHPAYDDWLTPIRVEQEFSVPLRDPYARLDHTVNGVPPELQCSNSPDCGQDHANPSPVDLVGRVDVLLKDKIRGGLYILDHKTTAQLITNAAFLELDDQISGYMAALRRGLGLDIRGFIYSECRKAYPSPPRVLKQRRAGGIISQDRSQLTTTDLYLQEIADQGEDPTIYADFLEYLRSPDAPRFHVRHTIRKEPDELDRVLHIAAQEAYDMIKPDIPVYPQPGRYTCSSCAFQQPCLTMFQGGNYHYTLDTLYTRRQPYGSEPIHP